MSETPPPETPAPPRPFWKRKSLSAMTRAEWESLCDGCGRCCLHKLRDEETEEVHFTNVACRMLDLEGCGCRDYANRRDHVPDCVQLKARMLPALDWLPPTCAYHILSRGGELPEWHPLVSGDRESVHRAGISVRGRVVSEREAGALEDHVVAWPGRWPARRARRMPNGLPGGLPDGLPNGLPDGLPGGSPDGLADGAQAGPPKGPPAGRRQKS